MMKPETMRIVLAGFSPFIVLFILYMIKVTELALNLDVSHFGVYPLQWRGVVGIFTHPLIHSDMDHLLANPIPLFFLSWCLFYFYRDLAYLIFPTLWIGSGLFTFIIGKPGWHIGASGVIYGLAFFLFFSGVLRRHKPLMAISLLVTFLYGSLVWQMFPHFVKANVSWEGHLSGAIAGVICAFLCLNYGPPKPEPIEHEEEASVPEYEDVESPPQVRDDEPTL